MRIFVLLFIIALSAHETIGRRKDGSVFPVEVTMGGIVLEGEPFLFGIIRAVMIASRMKRGRKIMFDPGTMP